MLEFGILGMMVSSTGSSNTKRRYAVRLKERAAGR